MHARWSSSNNKKKQVFAALTRGHDSRSAKLPPHVFFFFTTFRKVKLCPAFAITAEWGSFIIFSWFESIFFFFFDGVTPKRGGRCATNLKKSRWCRTLTLQPNYQALNRHRLGLQARSCSELQEREIKQDRGLP